MITRFAWYRVPQQPATVPGHRAYGGYSTFEAVVIEKFILNRRKFKIRATNYCLIIHLGNSIVSYVIGT
jgi:hypothetical protein